LVAEGKSDDVRDGVLSDEGVFESVAEVMDGVGVLDSDTDLVGVEVSDAVVVGPRVCEDDAELDPDIVSNILVREVVGVPDGATIAFEGVLEGDFAAGGVRVLDREREDENEIELEIVEVWEGDAPGGNEDVAEGVDAAERVED
jgi:hypothetical protein